MSCTFSMSSKCCKGIDSSLCFGSYFIYFSNEQCDQRNPQFVHYLPGCRKNTVYGLSWSGISQYRCLSVGWHKSNVLPLVTILSVLSMRYANTTGLKLNLKKQFSILSAKPSRIMTIIDTNTFASFIGFSAAFPELCQAIFVYTVSLQFPGLLQHWLLTSLLLKQGSKIAIKILVAIL